MRLVRLPLVHGSRQRWVAVSNLNDGGGAVGEFKASSAIFRLKSRVIYVEEEEEERIVEVREEAEERDI